MSLNGLEAHQLTEAFETAQSEPGGWFWIKYSSRDEVELACRGSNGTDEMREAAEKEPDDSPLYGFIRFRRRNMLIKYVPEGTSRVLKARSQVHFQSVTERFSPHDTTYSIEALKGLKDNALTSACSTHTATASISSSNSSLRQRRLADIAESADEEEAPCLSPVGGSSPVPFGETYDKGNGSRGLAVVVTTHDNRMPEGEPGYLEDTRDLLGSPTSANFPLLGDSPDPPRTSTNSPSPLDLYGYPFAPKVKLGPRPAESIKRPHSSNDRSKNFAGASEELRSSVPRSAHIPTKRSNSANSVSRTRSLTSESENFIPDVPPIPSLHPFTTQPSSPSSIHSMFPSIPNPVPATPAPDGPASLTPGKQRLMKALEMRKKKTSRKRDASADDTSSIDSPDSESKDGTPTKLLVENDEDDIEDEYTEEVVQDETQMCTEETADDVPEIVEFTAERKEIIVAQIKADHEEAEGEEGEEEKEEGRLAHRKLAEDKLNSGEQAGQEESNTEDSKEEMPEQETPTPPPPEDEHVGSTKVRGDPDSDSDTESALSMEVIVAKTRPMTMQPVQATSIPALTKAVFQIGKTPASGSQNTLKKPDGAEEIPPSEIPVVETARSVSAPFLKNAHEPKQPAVVRKVNVSSGGVAQRIKQLEMLSAKTGGASKSAATNRVGSPTPMAMANPPGFLSRSSSITVSSPPRSRSTPPAPSPHSLRRPSTAHGISPIPAAAPPLPSHDSIPQIHLIERDGKPELQVTTTIHRAEKPKSLSRKGSDFKQIFSRRKSLDSTTSSPVQAPLIVEENSSRRPSIDKMSFLSRNSSNRDLEKLPEGEIPISPMSSASSKSSLRSFKRGKSKERRSSSSSSSSSRKSKSLKSPTGAKSPGLLKRMSSSFTGKKNKEASAAPEAVLEADLIVPKKYLLNVQLPDTILWRRKHVKLDSHGWLFISTTDDENSPQTKKYLVANEVRNVDIPDLDEQDLPHSVRLSLHEGGTLQCACQDVNEQKELLSVIQKCIA